MHCPRPEGTLSQPCITPPSPLAPIQHRCTATNVAACSPNITPCWAIPSPSFAPVTGLPQHHYGVDFRTPPSADLTDYWHASSGSNITHDDNRGAGLQYVNRHDALRIETDFYIWYGRVDFDLQAALGRGVITSAALKPNEGEGVHCGWSGNDFG